MKKCFMNERVCVCLYAFVVGGGSGRKHINELICFRLVSLFQVGFVAK